MSNIFTPSPFFVAEKTSGNRKLSIFLCFLFCFFTAFLWGQEPVDEIPEYEWIAVEELVTVDANTTHATILSIATDPLGNVYTLSLSGKIVKRSSDGTLIEENFISAGEVGSPLDFAIDEDGYFYIADYEESDSQSLGQIKIFDPDGNFLPGRTISTYEYRPMGIDVDEDNIYVAEYYGGDENSQEEPASRVRVYDKNNQSLVAETEEVQLPFRIAVDSQKNIYVSHSGEENPQVLVFDSGLNFQQTLPDIESPGSIEIDAFDFVHVIEYTEIVEFSQFLDFEELANNFLTLFELIASIQEGIDNNEFVIKIYDTSRSRVATFKDNEANDNNIEFPVDIVINEDQCESSLYLNNADIDGFSLDFELEIYTRTPSFDNEDPVALCSDSGVEFLLENDSVTISPADIDAGSTDNCGIESLELSEDTFTEAGDYEITLTVTDSAGNTGTCSTTITIRGEEEPAPSFSCPGESEISPLSLDENCFVAPELDYLLSDFEYFKNDPYLEPFFLLDGNLLLVTIEVYDGEEGEFVGECNFEVDLIDDTAPQITSCISENPQVTIPEGGSHPLENYTNQITAVDNCDGDLQISQSPASGTEITADQEVIITVTDDSANQTECIFTVEVTVELEPEPSDPQFEDCPAEAIAAANEPGECGAIVDFEEPVASDDSGDLTVELVSNLGPGDFFPVGTTEVIYEATGESGETVSCRFEVRVEDDEAPQITACIPENPQVSIPEGGSYILDDYTNQITAVDNCDGDLQISQSPSSGTEITADQEVTITVTDESANQAECIFTVEVTVEQEPEPSDPQFEDCPAEAIAAANEPGECGAIVDFEEPVASDDSGDLTVELVSNLGPGDFFPVGATEVIYEATGEGGETVSCRFEVLVEDDEAPQITSCIPENPQVSIPEGGSYTLEDFTNQIDLTDNCDGDLQISQSPAPGTEITADQEVTITVTDESANQAECIFTVEVTVEQEPEPSDPQFENCPTEAITIVSDQGECGAIVDFEEPVASDDSGDLTVELVSNLGPGDFFPVGTTEVVYEATGESGETVSCRFEVRVEDDEAPQITSCIPENPQVSIPEGGSYILDDYTNQITAVDNCDGDLQISQNPSPGTEITADQVVTITVTDESANQAECIFTVEVTVEDTYQFECVGEYTVNLGEDAQNSGVEEIPTSDFVTSDTSNLEFELAIQQFTCEDIGTQSLTINATHSGTGEDFSCTVEVSVKDVGAPLIICPAEPLYLELPAEGYEVPDFFDGRISDNCNPVEDLDLTQEPPAGTIIEEPGSHLVELTATDTFGNVETCEIFLVFNEEKQFTCPSEEEIPDLELDENCEFDIPDFTYLIPTENFEPRFEQEKELFGNTLLVTVDIYDGEELLGECSFSVSLIDNIPPEITCPEDISAEIPLGSDSIQVDYDEPEVTDNCVDGITLTRVSGPASGSVFEAGIYEIEYAVSDESGNTGICSFDIIVTAEDEEGLELNCVNSEVELDENGYAIVNAEDFHEGEIGEWVFSLDKDEFDCSSLGENNLTLTAVDPETGAMGTCNLSLEVIDAIPPVARCVENYTLTLNSNNTATLSAEELDLESFDNCGVAAMDINKTEFTISDLGENIIILSVTDFSGNTNSCEVVVTVQEGEEPAADFQCREEVVVQLDENGEATLEPESLYTGNAGETNFSLSKNLFTCEDLGEQSVELSYSGDGVEGSCAINVIVEDKDTPHAVVQNIVIQLDEDGFASIEPRDIDNGSYDNCDEDLQFALSRSEFNCDDIGDNQISFTAIDNSGNSATVSAVVTVGDENNYCHIPEPGESSSYLFVYPNPSSGRFSLATPQKLTVHNVRLFDMRGRFLKEKEFPENSRTYQMDAGEFREGVYVLEIETNEGKKLRKMIIKK